MTYEHNIPVTPELKNAIEWHYTQFKRNIGSRNHDALAALSMLQRTAEAAEIRDLGYRQGTRYSTADLQQAQRDAEEALIEAGIIKTQEKHKFNSW